MCSLGAPANHIRWTLRTRSITCACRLHRNVFHPNPNATSCKSGIKLLNTRSPQWRQKESNQHQNHFPHTSTSYGSWILFRCSFASSYSHSNPNGTKPTRLLPTWSSSLILFPCPLLQSFLGCQKYMSISFITPTISQETALFLNAQAILLSGESSYSIQMN